MVHQSELTGYYLGYYLGYYRGYYRGYYSRPSHATYPHVIQDSNSPYYDPRSSIYGGRIELLAVQYISRYITGGQVNFGWMVSGYMAGTWARWVRVLRDGDGGRGWMRWGWWEFILAIPTHSPSNYLFPGYGQAANNCTLVYNQAISRPTSQAQRTRSEVCMDFISALYARYSRLVDRGSYTTLIHSWL